MGFLHKDIVGSSSEGLAIILRERHVASFDKIVVQCCVRVLWRADGHHREVQVIDGVGRDRGGDGILLPVLVGLADQDTSRDEPKANN